MTWPSGEWVALAECPEGGSESPVELWVVQLVIGGGRLGSSCHRSHAGSWFLSGSLSEGLLVLTLCRMEAWTSV